MRGSRLKFKFGVRRAHFTSSHASSSCAHVVCLIDSPRLLPFPLLAVRLLFHHLVHLPSLQLLLPRCGVQIPCALPLMRTLAPLPSTTLTGYEPNDYHIWETTELYIQESSGENGSLNSHDLEYDDYTISMALSSPLFTQEREDAASRRRAYHSHEEGLSSSQSSSSVGHGTVRPVVEQFDSLISKKIRSTAQKMNKSGFFWNDESEQILADCRAEIQKHEFQADYDRRSIQKLNEMIESQRGEIYRAHQGDEQLRRDQQLLHDFMNNYTIGISVLQKNGTLHYNITIWYTS